MVNNFDRILEEINAESERVAQSNGINSESCVESIMKIVDLEDKNRIRVEHSINKKIERIIQNLRPENSSEGD